MIGSGNIALGPSYVIQEDYSNKQQALQLQSSQTQAQIRPEAIVNLQQKIDTNPSDTAAESLQVSDIFLFHVGSMVNLLCFLSFK